jgi:hypothetical protein
LSGNVGRCSRCKKNLIREEFDNHVCNPPLQVREIRVNYWWLDKTDDGRPLIIAKGLEGILYRLSGDRKSAFEEAPDDSYHDKTSDDELPEPSTASSHNL